MAPHKELCLKNSAEIEHLEPVFFLLLIKLGSVIYNKAIKL